MSERPSKLHINLSNLRTNFRNIKAFSKAEKIMPILKADAYGHGALAIAKCLQEEGADYFGLAFLEEAIALREAGINTPILALGGLSGEQAEKFIDYDIDFTASSIFKLEKIESCSAAKKKKARVHLKIDTGMERIGVHHYSSQAFLEKALSCKNIEIAGLFSHFADSDNHMLEFSKLQLERFEQVKQNFEKLAGHKVLYHMANSGAVLQLPEAHYDMIRPGLLLYGVNPCNHLAKLPMELKPTLELTSQVIYFKVVKAGANVSYNCTWTAKEQTRVVTIPLGYGDGYPRQLSNKGYVLIRGKKHPIVGKVCMDQLMVDIGPNGEAYVGDQVVLIGEQDNQLITVEELAQLSGQDPRELLLNLKLRLGKIYTD